MKPASKFAIHFMAVCAATLSALACGSESSDYCEKMNECKVTEDARREEFADFCTSSLESYLDAVSSIGDASCERLVEDYNLYLECLAEVEDCEKLRTTIDKETGASQWVDNPCKARFEFLMRDVEAAQGDCDVDLPPLSPSIPAIEAIPADALSGTSAAPVSGDDDKKSSSKEESGDSGK